MNRPFIATSGPGGGFPPSSQKSGSGKKRKRSKSRNGRDGNNRNPPRSPKNNANTNTTIAALAPPVEGQINRLSHPPSVVSQFLVAGLDINEPVPSELYPGFPHMAIPEPRPEKRVSDRRALSRARGRFPPTGDDDKATTGGGGYETTTAGETTAGGALTGEEEENANESGEDAETRRARGRRKRKKQEKQEDPNRRRNKPAIRRDPGLAADEKAAQHERQVGGLVEVIKRSLHEGEVATAKRAFGLLVRSKVRGSTVDLRYAEYWRLGLEILLKEAEEVELKWRERRERRRNGAFGEDGDGELLVGEDDEDDEQEAEYRFAKRHKADVLDKVKAYYGSLNLRYSYVGPVAKHKSASGLVFYPAVFRFELDDVRSEHALELKRLERLRRDGAVLPGEEEDEEDQEENSGYDQDPMAIDPYDQGENYDDGYGYGMDNPDHDEEGESQDSSMNNSSGKNSKPKSIIDKPADRIRQHILGRLKDVAHRMDERVLYMLPYKNDYALLSLRAEIALQTARLSVPCLYPQGQDDQDESDQRRRALSPSSRRTQDLEEGDRNRHGSASPVPRPESDGTEEEWEKMQEGKEARLEELENALEILTRMQKEIRKNEPLDARDEEMLEQVRRELNGEGEGASVPAAVTTPELMRRELDSEEEDDGPSIPAATAELEKNNEEPAIPAAAVSAQMERNGKDTAIEDGEDGDDEAQHNNNTEKKKKKRNSRKKRRASRASAATEGTG